MLVISGTGDVLDPDDVAFIGSGGQYAKSAAWHLKTQIILSREIVRESLTIAADICICHNFGSRDIIDSRL